MNRCLPLQTALILAHAFTIPMASANSLPFDFRPTANLQYEWSSVDSEHGASVSDAYFRRARVGFRLEGKDRLWQFVAEHDLADRTPADAYLQWNPAPGRAIRVGQFKQPFLLEDAISDKQTAMLESSFVGVFAISRRAMVGLRAASTGRVDDVDRDGAIQGGIAESYGLAVTCYLHPNARLIANALWLDNKRRGISDTPFVAGLRLQLTY